MVRSSEVVWPQADRLAAFQGAPILIACIAQGGTKCAVRFRVIRLEPNGFPILLNGSFEVAFAPKRRAYFYVALSVVLGRATSGRVAPLPL